MESLLVNNPGRYSVNEAFDLCRNLAKTHYENFPVGSFLLPRHKRRHIYALYAFCRFVDFLGDQAKGNRLELLETWEEDLRRCYGGIPNHPILLALQISIQTFDIPIEPFLKLIKANRMDQDKVRYSTYHELAYYCEHSANPVGHLVLYIFGYNEAKLHSLSDYVCTALQLTNFWQDVVNDFNMGRIYIPLEDMAIFGYTEEDLGQKLNNNNLRELMAFEVARARNFYAKGTELVKYLDGAFKIEVAVFIKGGMKILDEIKRQRYDVISNRPSLSKWNKLGLTVSTLFNMLITGRP